MANPQLSAAELAELVNLYKQIDGLSQTAAENAANQAQQFGNARSQLDRLRREYQDWTSDIDSSLQSFKEISSELNKFKTGINDSKKSYSSLESIAQKIQYHQKGINILSSKELENLQKKAKQEKVRLENAQRTLSSDKTRLLSEQLRYENIIRQKEIIGANTDAEYRKLSEIESILNNINKAYAQNEEILNNTNNSLLHVTETLSEALKIQQKIEKSMGITGLLFDGLAKVPFIGQLTQAADISKEVQAEIQEIYDTEGRIVSKTEAMGMAFKKLGPKIVESLTDPLILSTFFFSQILNLFKSIDDGAGKLAKSMDMSYSGALGLRQELSSIATFSNDAAVNTKGLQESYIAIGSALGANADINKEDLITFTKLREQAGFTNEELTAMYKMSLVTGKSAEQTSKEFLGGAEALAAQKGLAINVKQLMKETSNASAAMKLSVAGGAKGLAEAAVQAKALGVTLDQVDKIAGSLLQFEDSISAELEAELLTGKQINLERARLAALNGDIATVAEEINNQIGGSAEFSKMNRIQQEAFAKAVGMGREELAASLIEQEALQKVGAKTGEEAKKRYEELRKTMSVEEAAKELGDDALARQYEQQNVQERFNQAVEKLKDIFVSIADGPISSILNAFATILSNSTAIKVIVGALGGLAGLWAFSMIQGAIAAIASASALTLGIGALAIAAGIGVATLAMNSASKTAEGNVAQVKDGIVGLSENGGPVVSKFEQGKLKPVAQGIKQDKVYLTTNQPESPSTSTTPSSTQSVVIHTHVMIDKNEVAKAVNEANLTTQVKT